AGEADGRPLGDDVLAVDERDAEQPAPRGAGLVEVADAQADVVDADDEIAEEAAGGGERAVAGGGGGRGRHRGHARSRIALMPWPTPMHIVAIPWRAPRAASSWARVTTRRAPEAPSGWPSAIAPPLGLTVSGSSSSSATHGIAWAANASLSSVTARSRARRPARARA